MDAINEKKEKKRVYVLLCGIYKCTHMYQHVQASIAMNRDSAEGLQILPHKIHNKKNASTFKP